jgi:hypothetical protein
MTLEVDEHGIGRGIAYMLSCDELGCGEHVHLGVPRKGTDPRLAARLSGWMLDENGTDFCPKHVENGKERRDLPLFRYEE